jgi:hypothetical protein
LIMVAVSSTRRPLSVVDAPKGRDEGKIPTGNPWSANANQKTHFLVCQHELIPNAARGPSLDSRLANHEGFSVARFMPTSFRGVLLRGSRNHRRRISN